jgi:uncharacterized protein involved in response to NO
MDTHAARTAPSPRLLAQAPHRLMFFIGASNLLLAMAWWALWLADARWQLFGLRQPQPYAGWLHAFLMQYQMLPSFIFGFLLTVFPRWMGLPDIPRWRYLPVGLGLFGGQLATLGPLLRQERGTSWHARACFLGLSLGMLGLLAWGGFLLGDDPRLAFASIKLGTFGLLLPVYFSVAHRMFPFFAANVVPGYAAWRPLWLLGAVLGLCLAHLGLELLHAYAWLWLADVPLLALLLAALWRWWPRGPAPGLLQVLFLGLSWLPLAIALYAFQSIAYARTGEFLLGRAPAHALFIGFFGSVLVAMVTRVTQGHSGRALVMPAAAWFAFAAIQLVALLRVFAEVAPDPLAWQAAAAAAWLLAFSPWVARIGRIYLSPRRDGKPG